uniref:38.7K protein n=1 Tax=Chrysodeixis chalcites nucleopolyhedrovirus TaxID=320432 RepID=T1QZU2_9ABAC|nr:38.7K protein [Chrysodeixis chalcites nucleopolyhedrovirus]AGE61846.1 38.7K protein [Chrysodeixis chalcites nucleopolyhedrovirus]
MFNFIKRLLFSGDSVDNDNNYADESDHNRRNRQRDMKSFSYIFNKKRLCFDDQFSFLLRYLFYENEIWILAVDFAEGIGLDDIDAAINFIENDQYKKTVGELLSFQKESRAVADNDDNKTIFIINKHGAMQILDNVNFKNKIEFTTWMIENVFDAMKEEHLSTKKKPLPLASLPIEEKMTEMLRVFDAFVRNNETNTIETLTKNYQAIETLKAQMCENFEKIEKKISAEELYSQLEKYRVDRHNHRVNRNNYRVDGHNIEATSDNCVADDCQLSCKSRNNQSDDDDDHDGGYRQMCRYESVRFPRDSSKHPRLAVFVKSLENNSTQIAFLSGQSKRHRAMKRKYSDMELVYDSIHPNPQLAMLCLNEELDMKNFNYKKKTRRTLQVESSVETVKSFIFENL